MKSGIVRIADLVGHNVRGVLADVTDVRWREEGEAPKRRKLIRAEWRREAGRRWLYLLWEKESSPTKIDCGYSGYGEDVWFVPQIEILSGGAA